MPIMFMLLFVFSPAVSELHCLDGKVFIQKESGKLETTEVKIVTQPNTTDISSVSGSYCGFQVEGLTMFCDNPITIKFVTFNLSRKSENLCSVWGDAAVCYCDFFGCNSVKGSLYESVLRTLKVTANDPVSQLETGKLETIAKRDRILGKCLVPFLEKANNAQLQTTFTESAITLDEFRNKYPSLFPNASEVAEMKQKGALKNPITLPPSTTVAVPTSAQIPVQSPTVAPSALHHGGPAGATAAPSNDTAALIGIIIGVIVVLILFALGLGYFLYRRRDKQQLEKIEEIEKKEEQEAKRGPES